MNTQNSKRLAKNTLMLYLRMLLNLGVSFYTVRVVLHTLGVVDYGIYNVVGGIAASFAFISNTMAAAAERFFAFEIGRNDHVKLKQLFSSSILIYLLLSLIILLLAQTLGLWFLNTKLTIPYNRLAAANYVYQFSIASFIVTILTVPYTAVIIARERMGFYAWISIIEVILQLGCVYILIPLHADKLKLYAVLMFTVAVVMTFIYRLYCKREFEECTFTYFYDKGIIKILLSYSGWNLFGTLTTVSFNQGIAFLLNIFFGPVISAAAAIATQVNYGISSFSSNFYMAVRPQIVKFYAEGNIKSMMALVYKSSKFSFFLLLIFSMPVLLETNFILKLWLTNAPVFAVLFVKLIIVYSLVYLLHIPITTAVQATGNIKKYQVTVGTVMLLCLPVFYTCVKFGLKPQFAYYTMIAVSAVAMFFRLRVLHSLIRFSYAGYLSEVILKILIVSLFSYILPLIIVQNMDDGWPRFLVVGSAAVVSSSFFIYFFGLIKDERRFITGFIKNYLKKDRAGNGLNL